MFSSNSFSPDVPNCVTLLKSVGRVQHRLRVSRDPSLPRNLGQHGADDTVVATAIAISFNVMIIVGRPPLYRSLAQELPREDAPDNAFVHVIMLIGHGRDEVTRTKAAEHVFAAVTNHLDPVFEARPLGISFEMREIDPATNLKKNNLHEYVKRRQAAE